MRIKFRGLNFHVFDWKENSWGINFCGHGGMVGTIVVGFAKKYAGYCGLIFVDKRHTTKSTKSLFIHLKNFYAYGSTKSVLLLGRMSNACTCILHNYVVMKTTSV